MNTCDLKGTVAKKTLIIPKVRWREEDDLKKANADVNLASVSSSLFEIDCRFPAKDFLYMGLS